MTEIDLGGVDTDEWIFSNSAEFDDSLLFSFYLEDDGCDDDCGLLWCELCLEVAVGVGKEDSFGGGY